MQTASGLRYSITTLGTGPTPQAGDKLVVEYSGFLPNGKVFDSSVVDGHPLRLRVGRGEVIKGWDEVLLLLPAGTRARVWIPAALAYGAKGARDPDDDSRYLIPPNTDLVFDLTVVKVR
ncbi:FKBP-type peptidyl-prolyl cis-trans isomerase [Hymenobacter citatus]|uniref:FKBP-type peptidyl-prolyl cis-trans isomerase n=1 Tax=Hymenobacter citatus TaxID=2763506 RepID=UPI001C20C677